MSLLLALALSVAQVPAEPGHWEKHCNGVSCQMVWVPDAVPQKTTWVKVPGTTWQALMVNGVQKGAYDEEGKVYRQYFPPNGWGQAEKCPVTPPGVSPPPAEKKEKKEKKGIEGQLKVTDVTIRNGMVVIDGQDMPGAGIMSDGTINFGVDPSPETAGHGTTINGQDVSIKEAIEALVGTLGNDSNKLRLTIIAPKEKRNEVMKDLQSSPDLLAIEPELNIKGYDPSAWQVNRSGFVTTGLPTIYVQAPSGKVLHRQDTYTGPEALAGALRNANDSYRRENDPKLNGPLVANLLGLPLEAWLVIAVVLWFVIPRKEAD